MGGRPRDKSLADSIYDRSTSMKNMDNVLKDLSNKEVQDKLK